MSDGGVMNGDSLVKTPRFRTGDECAEGSWVETAKTVTILGKAQDGGSSWISNAGEDHVWRLAL